MLAYLETTSKTRWTLYKYYKYIIQYYCTYILYSKEALYNRSVCRKYFKIQKKNILVLYQYLSPDFIFSFFYPIYDSLPVSRLQASGSFSSFTRTPDGLRAPKAGTADLYIWIGFHGLMAENKLLIALCLRKSSCISIISRPDLYYGLTVILYRSIYLCIRRFCGSVSNKFPGYFLLSLKTTRYFLTVFGISRKTLTLNFWLWIIYYFSDQIWSIRSFNGMMKGNRDFEPGFLTIRFE